VGPLRKPAGGLIAAELPRRITKETGEDMY